MRKRWSAGAIPAALLLAAACGGDREQLPGEVTIGTPSVLQGNVQPSLLTEELSELHPILDGCYAEALIRDPGTAGTVALRLTGNRTTVGANVASSTVRDTSLIGCVRRAVESIQLGDLAERGRPVEMGEAEPDSAANPVFVAEWSVNFTRD